MGHKWVNVTSSMRIDASTPGNHVQLTIFYRDPVQEREIGLFLVDSSGIESLSSRGSVHIAYTPDRKYAFLLNRPSGNLRQLKDQSLYRLSIPLQVSYSDFSHLANFILERKITAPYKEDITSQCKLVMVKSSQSTGSYIKVVHEGTPIAMFGACKNGVEMISGTAGKYKIEPAEGALVSFHVFRINK